MSDSESYLYDSAQVIAGTTAFSILAEVQSILAHTVFECSTAIPTLDSEVGSVAANIDSGILRASGRASLNLNSKADDTLTMLRPFSGSDPARLSISVDITVASYPNDLSVRYWRNEIHILSLPVDFRRIIALCLNSTRTIEKTLSNSSLLSCTPSAVAAVLGAIRTNLDGLMGSEGLNSSLGFNLRPALGCAVDFSLEVSQLGIKGPGGVFSVSAKQEGHATVRILNATMTG